jgi:carbon storage regulator
MLVLTRKLQQQIKIGEQITVTILRVKGQTVRVGIDAPRDVRVIRGELPKNGQIDSDQSTIIETRLVLEGESETLASDDSETPPDESITGDGPTAPEKPPHAPRPFRLPQRKRISRTSEPPLRVAMLHTPSLAK